MTEVYFLFPSNPTPVLGRCSVIPAVDSLVTSTATGSIGRYLVSRVYHQVEAGGAGPAVCRPVVELRNETLDRSPVVSM